MDWFIKFITCDCNDPQSNLAFGELNKSPHPIEKKPEAGVYYVATRKKLDLSPPGSEKGRSSPSGVNTNCCVPLAEHTDRQVILDGPSEKGLKLIQLVESGHLPMITRFLRESKVNRMLTFDINSRDEHGDTALHKAAATGQMEVCEVLVANGAVSVKNWEGLTPSDQAYAVGHKVTAEFCKLVPSGEELGHSSYAAAAGGEKKAEPVPFAREKSAASDRNLTWEEGEC